MKLEVWPQKALIDERINIRISDLPPSEKVKISASLIFPWAESVRYESGALFTSDSNGILDLAKQKPDSGSYDFIVTMGLIVSLKRVTGNFKDVMKNISIEQSLFVEITVECGQERSSFKMERLLMTPGMKRLKINDEFVGELFHTDNPNNKTIIYLGGSTNEDLRTILPPTALLASHGFNVLALAYFGSKGLNSSLAEIPLEYFENVFSWLEKNPLTNSREIYVIGGSIGAILALLLASRYPIIRKVVVFNPLAWSFQGLTLKKVSMWTYGNKQLPFIKFPWASFVAYVIGGFIKNRPLGFAYAYRKGLEIAKNTEDARIKIENSNAEILMFGGQKDGWWDTHDACLKMMEELGKRNYQHRYEYVSFENGGHACYAPFVIPAIEFSSPLKIMPRLVFSEGVTWEANAQMLEETWKRSIEFVKN